MKKTIIIVVVLIVIATTIYLLKWETVPTSIQQGDLIVINYEAALPDGRIFNSNEQEKLVIGENTLPWVDSQLIGYNSGDSITITVAASEGYGVYYDPNKLQRIPIYTLTQAWITPELWKFILLWWTRHYIQNIENDIATLDTNPEHTRQDLKYTIQILWHDKQKK